MWYDFQYGIQKLNSDKDSIYECWKSFSNDSRLIEGLPRLVEVMFQEEKEKLNKVLESSNVIVTHISPDWSTVPLNKKDNLSNSFYYFDGSDYYSKLKGKIWCFGHVHRRMDYIKDGCRFINASLGYPDENKDVPKKILTVKFNGGL